MVEDLATVRVVAQKVSAFVEGAHFKFKVRLSFCTLLNPS